jgi:hypothetical protein
MLSLLKRCGGPSTISPLAPILRVPSLPALNDSPSLPVIMPDASEAAA